MSKIIIVDFYKIELAEDGTQFEKLLQQAIALPPEERTIDVRSTPVHLHKAFEKMDFWEGEVIRIRMVDPPVKASRAGAVEDIFLEEDEGIGERTAFLYHCSAKVLLLQNTHSGVSVSTFLKFFQALNGDKNITAFPILQPDAMKKLDSMDRIQKYEMRIAGLNNPGKLFQDDDLAINSFQNIADEFRAPMMSMVLSVGQRKKDSLDVLNVLKLAKNLFWKAEEKAEMIKSQKVAVLRITGSTESEENEERVKLFVDLLRDRVRERVNSGVQGRGSIPYSIRIQALETAWNRRSQEILDFFQNRTNS